MRVDMHGQIDTRHAASLTQQALPAVHACAHAGKRWRGRGREAGQANWEGVLRLYSVLWLQAAKELRASFAAAPPVIAVVLPA